MQTQPPHLPVENQINLNKSSASSPTAPALSLFNTQGRISRLTFLAWNGVVAIIVFILMAMVTFIAPSLIEVMFTYHDSWGLNLIALVINLGFICIYIMIAIKRLHDVNQSGWLALLILVPLLNLIFSLYLIFMPGTAGENKYGPSRSPLGWEVMLGWTMVVFMCFALLISLTAITQILAML
ncbi:uncharacterized membrane protein YhaH (DUF805 family) [Acinetobacter calcoaceticus]|uniref:Uncharacterized membrane protein YhaH (DUF805 family) n=1 Tax=Acinetobacter calcoaceticus TaxID=471 RepID=A0A4V2R241_ACICA|nr:uncharacterized membrane protein YhaH (DUF805 family) [Acinetobacter calcoaceticus]